MSAQHPRRAHGAPPAPRVAYSNTNYTNTVQNITLPSAPYPGAYQYGTDPYKRPQPVAQSPYGYNGGNISQHSQQQYTQARSSKTQYPINQIGRVTNGYIDTRTSQSTEMARRSSAQSNGTNDSSPRSSTTSGEGKEKSWFCPHSGCLGDDGQLTAFARKDDLRRHIQIHDPNRQVFPCPVQGCSRVGERGLPRYDKLIEHMRDTHKLDIPKQNDRYR